MQQFSRMNIHGDSVQVAGRWEARGEDKNDATMWKKTDNTVADKDCADQRHPDVTSRVSISHTYKARPEGKGYAATWAALY